MKDYYNVKAVSNSSLSWFQKSPKYFKLMLDQEISEKETTYFQEGEMIHQFILEPEEFKKNYFVLDYDVPRSQQQKDFCKSFASLKKGSKDERLLKAYKETYTSKETNAVLLHKAKKLANMYKTYIKYVKIYNAHMYTDIISSDTLKMLEEIKTLVYGHDKARELLENDTADELKSSKSLVKGNEYPIYWEAPNGIQCKSLLDRLIINFDKKVIKLIDLKTTAHISEFKDKFKEYKYYRQMAFYWLAIYWKFMKEHPGIDINEFSKETYIIAISKLQPLEIRVFEVTDEPLNEGLDEIANLFDEIKWHQDNDKWDHSRRYYEGQLTEKL